MVRIAYERARNPFNAIAEKKAWHLGIFPAVLSRSEELKVKEIKACMIMLKEC